jgi:transposase
MDTAQDAPQTVILTEDEASMYLQATTQKVWSVQGQTPTVRVDPSRTKTNFYGTLNLQTGEELILRADKLNSETTAFYLNCVLETDPNVPILYFWDRAPWQRGAAIEHVLQANPRLEIICYPVASPELNPQEQVWKAARREVSHNHTQAQLNPLADQFENYLSSTRFASSFLDQYGYNTVRAMFI